MARISSLEQEHRQLKALLADYRQLHKIIATVGSALQVDAVIRGMIEQTLALCDADQGAVTLIEARGEQEARTLLREGGNREIVLDHFLNLMLTGRASRAGEALIVEDMAALIGEGQAAKRYSRVSSAISIPLRQQGQIMGMLNLIKLDGKTPFRSRDKDLLTILSPVFAQYLSNARSHETLFAETVRLRKEVEARFAFGEIIGHSAAIRKVFAVLEKVIPTDARVLIQGESGTGKELVARVIHYSGPRAKQPFVAIDCGALPANLLEGELFGYVKGAFTGALKDKQGLLETAEGGTVFLDEITNMPLELQTKFLRVLQENEIRPLGGTTARKIDVRIVAACGVDLRKAVEDGKFREDLFYRLHVVPVVLPPLRERREDIPLLAVHFLEKLAERHHKNLRGFQPATLSRMEAYSWPGNVRELENVIERMVILAENTMTLLPVELLPSEIVERDIAPLDSAPEERSLSIRERREKYEKNMLMEALVRNDWNQSAAARDLGVSERTVRYKMQRFGIKKFW